MRSKYFFILLYMNTDLLDKNVEFWTIFSCHKVLGVEEVHGNRNMHYTDFEVTELAFDISLTSDWKLTNLIGQEEGKMFMKYSMGIASCHWIHFYIISGFLIKVENQDWGGGKFRNKILINYNTSIIFLCYQERTEALIMLKRLKIRFLGNYNTGIIFSYFSRAAELPSDIV